MESNWRCRRTSQRKSLRCVRPCTRQTTPPELVKACRPPSIDGLEDMMRRAGYGKSIELIRPANETRFEARWRLGQMLAKMERQKGGRGLKLFPGREEFLWQMAQRKRPRQEPRRRGPAYRRHSYAPEESTKGFYGSRRRRRLEYRVVADRLCAAVVAAEGASLLRHRAIADAAAPTTATDIGTFPLDLAFDPPWRFGDLLARRAVDAHRTSIIRRFPTREIIDLALTAVRCAKWRIRMRCCSYGVRVFEHLSCAARDGAMGVRIQGKSLHG